MLVVVMLPHPCSYKPAYGTTARMSVTRGTFGRHNAPWQGLSKVVLVSSGTPHPVPAHPGPHTHSPLVMLHTEWLTPVTQSSSERQEHVGSREQAWVRWGMPTLPPAPVALLLELVQTESSTVTNDKPSFVMPASVGATAVVAAVARHSTVRLREPAPARHLAVDGTTNSQLLQLPVAHRAT